MRCIYCGMDSRNPQLCEWCHRPLAAPGQPPAYHPTGIDLTQPVPPAMDLTQPVPQHQFRTALTGEVVPVAPASAPGQAYPPQPYAQPPYPQPPYPQQPYPQQYQQPIQGQTAYPPQPYAQQPYPPQAYPPQAYPPQAYPPQAYPPQAQAVVAGRPSAIPRTYAGLPHQAIGTDMARAATASYRTPLLHRWEKCLAISMPILLVSVWIVHLNPVALTWVVVADFFLIAMAMGGTASIGSYDDEYLDVGAALIVSIFFGPVIGLVVYVIVGAIKQEFNTAIIALLLGHVLVRTIVMLAFPMNAGGLTVMPGLLIFSVSGLLSICATFAGWMLSSFFRPMNE